MIEFMVKMEDVKVVYQSNSYWTYRLLFWYENIEVNRNILRYLGLSKAKVIKLLKNYQYQEKQENLTFIKTAVKCFILLC